MKINYHPGGISNQPDVETRPQFADIQNNAD
jgi:hypothetical protein